VRVLATWPSDFMGEAQGAHVVCFYPGGLKN
jgi:hypothetical protein